LEGVLAETFDPADLPAEEPIAPDLLPATVVAVIDAETIEVEIAGVRQQVRYLGVEAPADGACWSAEAVQANASLVAGQTVWLERQRSNADRQGRLLRDVWISAVDGGKLLVAERLVALGAAEPKPTTPNTRLSGWLAGVAQDAAAVGAGRWGFCPVANANGGLALGPAFAAVLPLVLGLVWITLGTPGLETLKPGRRAARREEDSPGDRDG
jgi:endonuclease YncB( thermonuclease family)